MKPGNHESQMRPMCKEHGKSISCKIKLRNMSQPSLVLLLLSSFLGTVQCWADGYTQDICGSLTPSDTNPQDSSSPYSLTVAVSRYIIGGEVEGKNVFTSIPCLVKFCSIWCHLKIKLPVLKF